jgi:exopolysaccharide biosynthesis polyprenyl glycosylphosphotransferase
MSAHSHQLPLWPVPATLPDKTGRIPASSGRRIVIGTLVSLDLLMLAAAFFLAYVVRFQWKWALAPEVPPAPEFYTTVGLTLIPLWLGLFSMYGLYKWEHLLGGITEYSRAFNAITVGMMMVVAFSFFEPSFVIARGWLITSWLLALTFIGGARFVVRRIVYSLWRRGVGLTPAIIVGCNGEAATLTQQLMSGACTGYQILGLVGPKPIPEEQSFTQEEMSVPHLGELNDIARIMQDYGARELIVASSSLNREDVLDLFAAVQPLSGVNLRLSTGLYEVLTTGIEVRTTASVPLIQLKRLRLSVAQTICKNILEYAVATLTLLALSPLMAVIAVLVKLDSPGPIIYRRRVMGVGGVPFDAFKFRTMPVNGARILDGFPELQEKLWHDGKLKDDPRVSMLGRLLRRFSLDELPQLFNVLLGQMSLVGPRMITEAEGVKYGQHLINLLTVKPGITGLWQVSGRSELSYVDRVRLDLHYIRNYSIWLDLQILIVQTPSAVIRGHGAY